METNMLMLIRKAVLRCLAFLIFLVPLKSMSQDVDLSCPNPGVAHTLVADLGNPFNAAIGVQGSTGNVFWGFLSTPGSSTSTDGFLTDFTRDGITVTLPTAGAPDDAVSDALTLSISGTSLLTATTFSFTVRVTDEGNPALTCDQEYELTFSAASTAMDLVLVLDRSGSMTINTTSGVSRWNALRQTVANFGNMYQALGRTEDRIGITYFDTSLNPASTCCNTLIPVNATIGTTIFNDLPANPSFGMTAMGMGLQDAQTKLSDASRSRSILLFTDGQQNQAPWVNLNGQGYDDGTSIPGGNAPGGIKVSTIGIGGPGVMNTTLQNLALNNRGSYNSTQDGSAFAFHAGDAEGDLSSGFTDQFVALLSEFSPQLVARSSTPVASGAAPFALQSFPLNRRVDKLLLEFVFDRNFEIPELVQMMGRIQILKDGNPVIQYARPSWVGNYTNTLLLTFDFNSQAYRRGSAFPLTSEGDWSVQLADVSNLRINHCKLTVLADDHRLHLRGSYGDTAPKVNDVLPLSLTLDWLGHPIEDASVEAIVLRPGEDLGDLLAQHPLVVDISAAEDAGSPGTQKFEHLWATDSAFREQLKKTDNLVTLNHARNGNYESSFDGLNVAGAYHLLFRVSGNHPGAGVYQRILSRSFYTSFSSVDIKQSAVNTQLVDKQLIMSIKPKTSYGRFVGPAMGDAFSVSDTSIRISRVVDHQDGSYTITFTGDIGAKTTLQLLGQDIYHGKLENAGKSASIIDRINDWLVSLGLPAWSIWILVLLILLLLWLMLRKKK